MLSITVHRGVGIKGMDSKRCQNQAGSKWVTKWMNCGVDKHIPNKQTYKQQFPLF